MNVAKGSLDYKIGLHDRVGRKSPACGAGLEGTKQRVTTNITSQSRRKKEPQTSRSGVRGSVARLRKTSGCSNGALGGWWSLLPDHPKPKAGAWL
jgi:hypothetical protein